jgi:BirA family biotin operon repressor/biotin-[acetyl-CoA-carboxylase] ligase
MVIATALDIDRVRAAVGHRWERLDHVAEIGSTNTELLSDPDAPDRSVLVADYQNAGRGRLDRQWVSPPGLGLTFSMLFRPTTNLLTWPWLPLLVGVALREAVQACTGVTARLKWPNDLLLAGADGRLGKGAGILAQTGHECVVVGVGLNVSLGADDLPVPTATSLAQCGADTTRTELLIAVLTAVDARYSQWADFTGDAEACGLFAAYVQACATIGQRVRVSRIDGPPLQGMAVGLDNAGRLRVDVDGDEHVIGAGDVEHASAG